MSLCESEQQQKKNIKLDKHTEINTFWVVMVIVSQKQIYPGLHLIWQTAFNTLFKHLKFIYFQSSRE